MEWSGTSTPAVYIVLVVFVLSVVLVTLLINQRGYLTPAFWVLGVGRNQWGQGVPWGVRGGAPRLIMPNFTENTPKYTKKTPNYSRKQPVVTKQYPQTLPNPFQKNLTKKAPTPPPQSYRKTPQSLPKHQLPPYHSPPPKPLGGVLGNNRVLLFW